MARKKGKRQLSTPPDHKRELSDDNFGQMMGASFKPERKIQVGDEVEGKVIGFDNDYVFLDMGTRLDGILKRSDLRAEVNEELAEAQKISVFVTGLKNGSWQCAGRIGGGDTGGHDTEKSAAVLALEDASRRKLPVEGKVSAVIKGGFEIQVMGQKAFCPISQIDTKYCDAPDIHLSQTYAFEIIRFEESGKNIVVSRRNILQQEAEKRATELWKHMNDDSQYEGVVTSIQKFGLFIDIGGVDGLLHISEISYERDLDIENTFNVGQKLKVAIKTIDREKKKIGLTLKPFIEDPWTAAVKKLSEGGEFEGKVVRMKTFGAFIELFPGVDGMVHISRLGTDRRHQHPKEVLSVGDMVTVRVMEIDSDNKKISLTMEKEEGDFSRDLAKLKKEQDAQSPSQGQMSNLFDQALNKKD
ncbi:MAG: S1 RNA-binding domain-containing protein [bacterium]|nr:S1 RNA-binding domain-containing protein [bacterium]